mgnify:FL=1
MDGTGAAYVTGRTASSNFPVLAASQGVFAGAVGATDAFVTKLGATGAQVYSTYLGGSGFDSGSGIAVDGAGAAYVTGQTGSSNFPVLAASQGVYAGSGDAFITKLMDQRTAQAGSDQSVPEGTEVTLDGSGSGVTNPTYQWTQVGGTPVSLVDFGSANPKFTAPHVSTAGEVLTFQLIVCEGTSSTNCSNPDSVNVRVNNVNQPPVSDAGPDQTVQEGSPVILDGSGSFDPDLETLTYHWTQTGGPAVALSDAHTVISSFVAPNVGPAGATLVFNLTVTDPHVLTGSKSVSIHISNLNQIPTADAGSDQTVNEQTGVTLNGSLSTDPDLDTLHFMWTQTGGPSVSLTGATTVSPTFTAPAVGVGGVNLIFQLVVSDGQALSAADTVIVHIQDTNDPPVCALAHPSVESLWPPNHTMVPVGIMGITDPNDQAVTITFTGVIQDEPVNGVGDGDTGPDAAISGNQILLRAERAGTGNGRVYVVRFTATDEHGSGCNGMVKVSVPRDKKDVAVEGPQLHNSFGP